MKACKWFVNASETDLPRTAAIVSSTVATRIPSKSVRPVFSVFSMVIHQTSKYTIWVAPNRSFGWRFSGEICDQVGNSPM